MAKTTTIVGIVVKGTVVEITIIREEDPEEIGRKIRAFYKRQS